ncbi:MAG TPA: MaoC/PaaZ C-terminal domain-containing protein [Bryobacteraceae bacterium]|nr:acyl dehydratase [Bryobacterales bacterium]HRJ20425.1 MaoC/PaaZ C-terminal domain-containing protein [Bryobacteraceae bacterium]
MSQLLFYEDIEPGLSIETAGLTITDAHIVQYAGLSGDFFALHMDDEFARSLGFPRRVAHGLLGLILLDGLKNRAEKTFASVASLSWQWNFRKPLFAGDRIVGRLTVTEKRLTSKGNRGILTLALELRNAQGEIIQEGTNLLLVRTRADEPGAA